MCQSNPSIAKCITQGPGNYGLIMANEDQVDFDSNAKRGVTWASERKSLSFRRGDVINIIDDKNAWWMGELNGQRSWVPPSYLQPETPSPAPQKH